jgi:hypothetical protein
VPRGFLEAGCDAAELLEFGEAAFDDVSLGVESLSIGYLRALEGLLRMTATAPLLAMGFRRRPLS